MGGRGNRVVKGDDRANGERVTTQMTLKGRVPGRKTLLLSYQSRKHGSNLTTLLQYRLYIASDGTMIGGLKSNGKEVVVT
jgi:hypothetical protein